MYGGGGRSGSTRGFSSSPRNSGAARAWSWEGRGGVRDTSPGWHAFAGTGNRAGMAGRSGFGSLTGRAGTRSMSSTRAAVADGRWHSFGMANGGVRSALAVNSRSGTSFNRFGGVGTSSAFHGGRGGFFGGRGGFYRGGFGWGGWGYPAFGFGWGLGWGLGGWGWDPFWYWPPYWYDPWWYGYPPSYVYPYPY
jgi:hypothetical protein